MKASTLPPARGAVGRAHRTALVAGAVLAMVFGATACAGGTQTATSTSTTTTPSLSDAAKDDAYIAELTKWAKRDGYPMGDEGELIQAGNQVCSLLDAGTETSVISASADVMRQLDLSGQVAQAVGTAAVENLCPAHDPLHRAAVTPPQSTSPPVATPPFEGAPSSAPVHSQVMNVTLPAGTTTVGKDAGTIPGIEIWHVPLDPAAAVDYIRPQLPTGPYEGLPACPVDVTQNKFDPAPITTWNWENAAGDYVQISVKTFWLKADTPGPGSEVDITRDRETTPEPC
jgi:Protein of unknown function (DUF732)